MDSESLVTYVGRSELRTAVLRAIERDPRTTGALHAALDVSQSGVYKTLDELAECGLVREGDEWVLTARGRLVADELDRARSLDALLDDEFWETHDVSVLPRRFRQRLAGVGTWDLYRNPARNPQLLERWAVELFREADWVCVGAQVYYPRFANTVDTLADRGVLDAEVLVDERLVVESVERYDGTGSTAGVDERVRGLDFSYAVTESLVALSLPSSDGVSDLDAVLVGAGDAAVDLGRDLHEYYWEGGDPVEEHLATA